MPALFQKVLKMLKTPDIKHQSREEESQLSEAVLGRTQTIIRLSFALNLGVYMYASVY